jgi:phage terminase large subunit-like protein
VASSLTDALPRFACPDWWEKIQAGETPMADVPLNEERAGKALAFFNRLRLPDVPGRPAMKDACGQWFRDILCAFLASEDPDTKRRLVWELLCLVPKKNSKTTYVAGLGLTALFLEETPNAQMLIIAPSQNISERCFSQAQGMIQSDPTLEKVFHVQEHLKRITRRKTGAQLEVKSFDTGIVTGEIPTLTIIDELHELGKKRHALKVMQQIRGGSITKQGGQVLFITTQSDEEPTGIWKAELQKARAIRDGKGGPRPILLPVMYEFPEALQKNEVFWRNRDNWHLVLPNLDLSIDRLRLEEDYDNNGSKSKEAEQVWVSQHLNIEIGLGLHSDRWAAADYWVGNADEDLTLDRILATSDVAVIGGDAGGADDLFSLAVIGRKKVTHEWQVYVRAWCLDVVLDRRQDIAARLKDFAARGDLVITESAEDHILGAVELCDEVRASGLLPAAHALGFDPWGIAALTDALLGAGFDPDQLTGVAQGFKLNGAIIGLERRLIDGKLTHGNQPILNWAIGNAKAEKRGNNVMITKQAAGTAKIDPLIAVINAAVLMDRNPSVSGATPWDLDPNYRLAG